MVKNLNDLIIKVEEIDNKVLNADERELVIEALTYYKEVYI